MIGELHRNSAYCSACTINQNLLSALDVSFSKTVQCMKSPSRDGGGFLICHVGRFHCHPPIFRQTVVLSPSTKTKTGKCKNLVSFLKQSYSFAYRFNFPASSCPSIF